jgi:hypothetical protein
MLWSLVFVLLTFTRAAGNRWPVSGGAAEYFNLRHPVPSAAPRPPAVVDRVDSADRFQHWWNTLEESQKKAHYLRGRLPKATPLTKGHAN